MILSRQAATLDASKYASATASSGAATSGDALTAQPDVRFCKRSEVSVASTLMNNFKLRDKARVVSLPSWEFVRDQSEEDRYTLFPLRHCARSVESFDVGGRRLPQHGERIGLKIRRVCPLASFRKNRLHYGKCDRRPKTIKKANRASGKTKKGPSMVLAVTSAAQTPGSRCVQVRKGRASPVRLTEVPKPRHKA